MNSKQFFSSKWSTEYKYYLLRLGLAFYLWIFVIHEQFHYSLFANKRWWIILCQNWQFWSQIILLIRKLAFFAKILKFCLLQSKIGKKFEYFGQKIAKLAIISPILAPKLPFFYYSLFANKFNFWAWSFAYHMSITWMSHVYQMHVL